jgi:hypothetical protein
MVDLLDQEIETLPEDSWLREVYEECRDSVELRGF